MQVCKKREIASADASKQVQKKLVISVAVRNEFLNGMFHKMERGDFPVRMILPNLDLKSKSSIGFSLPVNTIFLKLFLRSLSFLKI
jgi:hypothetical protein